MTDNNTFTFSNQASIYNNIATAINNGLVPILKFVDGYGYYKEYLSSSSEYVFTLNHISTPELATNPANNVITLKIGNTTNKCYYSNLSQIPTTVVISSDAFGDSGSLTSTESRNLRELLTTAQYNLSAGIFILNNIDKKIYYVTESKSEKFTTLMAYTMNLNSVEVLNFTYSGGVFNYTKTTYALGGGSSASKMINLGTLSNSGTLEADKLQELMTLFQNGDLIQATFVFNTAQFITASAYATTGTSMGIVAYTTVAEFGGVVVVDLSINMTDASYTITPIEIPAHFHTINGFNITGTGNIAVQEPLVSGTNIKTINNKSILGSGNIEISGGESNSITIDLGTITNINNHLPAYILSSDEKSAIDNAYNNNKSVYVKFNYTNENNNTETIILPIESKIAQTGGAYSYYGGGTLQNHEVWHFSISVTSVFVNNITNATDNEVNNLFTNPGQAIPDKTISLENLNAFKQQIENEINNEIGQVLEEGF